MRTADLLTAAVLVLLGGTVVFDSVRIGIGWSTDGPKSGFFPFWLGVILLTTCAMILAQAWRRSASATFVSREQLRPVLIVLAPAVAMVALTHAIGLYVSAAIYIGFYMRSVGRHGWLAVLVIGVGIPLATFLVFERWFLVPMPKGPLETWLGY